MIDERAYELLCCQLGLANEEKAGLRKQVNELIARLKAIEESNKENSKALMETINELSATVENYRKEMELMRKQLGAKDEVNRMLANEISNLKLQLDDSRKHRFGRTSEQRRLLNNRNLDTSAMEKSEYDGYDKKDDDNNKAGVSRGHYNMMLLAGIMEILSATIKEMRVGPSQSVYRNRLQTITSCVLSNQKVVNVVCNKSEDMVRYV